MCLSSLLHFSLSFFWHQGVSFQPLGLLQFHPQMFYHSSSQLSSALLLVAQPFCLFWKWSGIKKAARTCALTTEGTTASTLQVSGHGSQPLEAAYHDYGIPSYLSLCNHGIFKWTRKPMAASHKWTWEMHTSFSHTAKQGCPSRRQNLLSDSECNPLAQSFKYMSISKAQYDLLAYVYVPVCDQASLHLNLKI